MGDDETALVPRDFGSWYEHCHDRVLAGVRVATNDADHARDAVSDAFTRAFEQWDRVSVMERPEAWVYTVAVNGLRRRWRRARTEARLLTHLNGSARATAPADAARDHDLWVAVDALPPRQRQAIALRYVLGLTQREVALTMGVSDGTAASTLAKARARLAVLLDSTEEAKHE